MGWTSKQYNGQATHLTFNKEAVADFLAEEFYNQLEFALVHLHQAKDKYDRNEIYVVCRNTPGSGASSDEAYIMVILVEILNGEIYWKETPESMGPLYKNCPVEFFKWVTIIPEGYARDWRVACMKKNVKFNKVELDGTTQS
tara:strand:- start:254 stop:679 length:426 start_codon:yes stop_codon:yes gene_type:complete